MNNQFNYAGFVELFLESDDEHEPYGVNQPAPGSAEPEQVNMPPPPTP